mgnify:FL=1
MNKIHKIDEIDKDKFNFSKLVENIFNCPLNKLHTIKENDYELFTQIGKDSNTEFHKQFYGKYREGWNDLVKMYKNFVFEVLFPMVKELTGEEEFAYQTFPSFRVQLPNNVAVVKYHYDSDDEHGHPDGEINFVIPLTKMYDTNAIWAESEPKLGDHKPIEMDVGEYVCWNFNKCSHGNKINTTGETRVSFDFRILPLSKYIQSNINKLSASTNTKFRLGNYYRYLSQDVVDNFNRTESQKYEIQMKDSWDREKLFFNNVLQKYSISDPWDIVDLFERKIAKYAGSKFAIAVDNCTNALFLCLKYLNATGDITIPSKTYVSVPCTIIHAGCEVKFEDIEWSGMYQLKPYPVYDGAVRFHKGMYKPDTYHCLSFHIRKHIPIGKGGMILCDDYEAYKWFQQARYEGRHTADKVLYKDDNFSVIGWNMYMTPEQAAKGLALFEEMSDENPDQESSGTCKDLSVYPVFTNTNTNTNTNMETNYYKYDYWFNNSEHDCWDQGGQNYYVNKFYEDIIFKLDDIPSEGYIVVLGTHNCVAFDKLCKYFGNDRVIGYDINNPNKHSNVIIKDCNTLGEVDNVPIAFLHNDLGSFSTTPRLKFNGYKWAVNNIVKGGYILGNNNLNRAKINIEEFMTLNEFTNTHLQNLDDKNFNLDRLRTIENHNGREFCALDGYMLSKKC